MSDHQNATSRSVNEANQCIAIGAGVGALGLTVGTIVGATCPLCYVVAPSLIGVGLFQRIRARLKNKRLTKNGYLKIREKSYKAKEDQ